MNSHNDGLFGFGWVWGQVGHERELFWLVKCHSGRKQRCWIWYEYKYVGSIAFSVLSTRSDVLLFGLTERLKHYIHVFNAMSNRLLFAFWWRSTCKHPTAIREISSIILFLSTNKTNVLWNSSWKYLNDEL